MFRHLGEMLQIIGSMEILAESCYLQSVCWSATIYWTTVSTETTRHCVLELISFFLIF